MDTPDGQSGGSIGCGIRLLALTLAVAWLLATVATVAQAPGRALVRPEASASAGRYRGIDAETWAARYRRRTRQLQTVRRVLFANSSVVEALNLACATYGHCSELWRKARCESQLEPDAANPSGARGLFQFLGSTWASTPYRVFDVDSPYASALAAGWMHTAGRGGEWVCR